jgi:hypothetical protein
MYDAWLRGEKAGQARIEIGDRQQGNMRRRQERHQSRGMDHAFERRQLAREGFNQRCLVGRDRCARAARPTSGRTASTRQVAKS